MHVYNLTVVQIRNLGKFNWFLHMKTDNNKDCQGHGDMGTLYITGVDVKLCNHFGNRLAVPQNVTHNGAVLPGNSAPTQVSTQEK